MENLSQANSVELEIYKALKTVIDPELAVNIVDLGLVYKIEYNEEEGIKIEVTLSTKDCPMGDVIMEDMQNTITTAFPGKKLDIALVWEPRWTPDRLTAEGKEVLGITS